MPARTTTLYRFFNADGALLYVGISVELAQRLRAHSRTQPWWEEVATTTTEQYPSTRAAQNAEVRAIVAERPRYNVACNLNRLAEPDPVVVHYEATASPVVGGGGLVEWLEALPAIVRAERERRGLSYRAAADELGIAYPDLHRLEHGKGNPRMSTLLMIAQWMDDDQTSASNGT